MKKSKFILQATMAIGAANAKDVITESQRLFTAAEKADPVGDLATEERATLYKDFAYECALLAGHLADAVEDRLIDENFQFTTETQQD